MTLFIAAPTGTMLATYSWEDEPELRPLVGWTFDPGERIGDPVILDGVRAYVMDAADGWRIVAAADLASFDLGKWADAEHASYGSLIAFARKRLLSDLVAHPQGVPVRYGTAEYYAAQDLVDEGLAEWRDGSDKYQILKPSLAGR